MYCISISHKTAPIEIREQFAFTQAEQLEFAKKITMCKKAEECVVVSTCNRNEIYFAGGQDVLSEMEVAIADYKGMQLEKVLKYYRIFEGEKCIYHLHQVTCGFDSMVLGEDEILRQVREAYERAKEGGTTGFELNRSFQSAFACSKRIKTDTRLSRLPISIGTLVANEIFNYHPGEKKVLIIGITGKMGSIIMKNIYDRNTVTLMGTLRRHHRELEISYPEVQFLPYENRYQAMDQADIIISTTASPHFTIVKDELQQVLLNKKERLFIDLAVPMDIDREIRKLPGVTLFDIDYFQVLSKDNNDRKMQELEAGNGIIDEQTGDLMKELAFHERREMLDKVFEEYKERNFRQVFYEMRDCSDYKEFKLLLDILEKLKKEEK